MRRIGILQNCSGETAGVFATVLAEAGHEVEHLRLFDGQDVPSADAFDGWLVMGGPMNVDETARYPHLTAERRRLAELIAADRPVLGICLGAQLLARAAGARVYPNPCKEVGLCTIEWTTDAQADPVVGGLPARMEVFQWHGDTFDLPTGAVWLARSDACTHQSFRLGRRVYGLQFHLECTEQMVRELCVQCTADLEEAPETVLARWSAAGLESSLARQAEIAARVIERWAALMDENEDADPRL